MIGWIVTCFLFMLLPGPDMALVTSWVLRRGPGAGLLAVLGINLSFLIYAILCLLGVAALIYRRPDVLDALRLLGGAYLIYLAVAAARESSSVLSEGEASGRSPLASGFVSNLLNPKQIIFLVAVLPAFLPGDPASLEILWLLLALVVVSWVFWLAWIYGLSGIASRLSERVLRRIGLLVALGLFILGVVLMASALS